MDGNTSNSSFTSNQSRRNSRTMHRHIRRAYTSLLERGYAKIATIGCLSSSSLDMMIARATSPDDAPLPEPFLWDLAVAFSNCPASSRAFTLAFARRFSPTRSWRVALKCLLLLHRLLQTLPACHPFRTDLLSARDNALVAFRPCRFRDLSSTSPHEYTAFVCAYARLLDGVLTCCQYSSEGTGEALKLVHQFQNLVDRAMDCVPAGLARSFLVRYAMEQIARESFACYLTSRRALTAVLDGFLDLSYDNCFEGLAVYKRAAEQAVRLREFYHRCRRMELCGAYEYPIVEEIPKSQVKMLEAFVEKMLSTTESSSASTSELVTAEPSEEGELRLVAGPTKEVVITHEWEKFEEEPLIQFEQDSGNWELLLEASVDRHRNFCGGSECWNGDGNVSKEGKHELSLQVFSPHMLNPFFCS